MHESSSQDADREAAFPTASPRVRPSRLVARMAALSLLWFVVAGGTPSSWVVGMPAIVAVAWLTPAPRRGAAWRLHPVGVLRFAGFLLRGSLLGGLDVAARVSAPRPRLAPGLLRYPLRLPDDGPARPLFALCVSLLPGTLVARFDDDTILVHALDTGAAVADELAALEQAVAGALALPLRASPSGHG